MLVCALFIYPLRTRPPVQRASGISCSLFSLGDNDMQSSGTMRRENAEVYPLFEIDSEIYPRHCEERSCPPKPAFGKADATKQSSFAVARKLDCFAALAMTGSAVRHSLNF